MLEELIANQYFLGALIIWTMIWKGLALWKAGNLKEKYWFIALFILNTAGILPIIYLFMRSKDKLLKKAKKKK